MIIINNLIIKFNFWHSTLYFEEMSIRLNWSQSSVKLFRKNQLIANEHVIVQSVTKSIQTHWRNLFSLSMLRQSDQSDSV